MEAWICNEGLRVLEPDSLPGGSRRAPINPNVTRDHLANERTLLSWVRTCIAIVALGFVIARFGLVIRELGSSSVNEPPRGLSTAIGVALVVCGALLVIPATFQFRRTTRAIEDNSYKPSFALIVILAGGFVVVAVLMAIYLLLTA
jgi:putative membrane protein